MKVAWSARGRREALVAEAWWAQSRPLAPTLLREELARALAQLASAPLSGAPFEGSFRRVVLRRTRYALFYQAEPAPEEPTGYAVKIVSLRSMLRGKPPTLGGSR